MSPFHGLLVSFRHFFCVGLFAMFADIADTGGTVAVEYKGEELGGKIVVETAFLNIHVALSAGMEAFLQAATPDFAPLGLLVLVATGTLIHSVLPACATIKSARSYRLHVSFHFIYHFIC